MRLALPPWLDALRPSQLAKNALVLAGFFFALPDRHQAGIDPLAAGIRTLAAAATPAHTRSAKPAAMHATSSSGTRFRANV